MHKQIFATITIAFLSYAHAATASEGDPFSTLDTDMLTETIAWAYADYNDPIEFTYLATVSKAWHAAIQSPRFMDMCKTKGYTEPVMMFRYVPLKQPAILEQDLTPANGSDIHFKYIDPREMQVDFPFIGFFYRHGFGWKNADFYVGIWTNPSKALVFNQWLFITSGEEDRCAQSHMKIAHYIAQHEKKKKLQKENLDGQYLMQHPITAEPLFLDKRPSNPNYTDCLVSYDIASTKFETPILKRRFIKKIPSSFKFLVPFSILPAELLTEIVASAYADYDDPIEFTHLATVSKTWYAIAKDPHFMKTCKTKGFVEPVMIFHTLGRSERKQPDILEKNLMPEEASLISEIRNSQKNTVGFWYHDPKNMQIDMSFKGLFWEGNSARVALWVNPLKTMVFNSLFKHSSGKTDCFFQSKMNLLQYITHYDKGQKLKAENKNPQLMVVYDPITAVPTLAPPGIGGDYSLACVFIAAPVSAKQFVKKWPASFKFEKFIPIDTHDLIWEHRVEDF